MSEPAPTAPQRRLRLGLWLPWAAFAAIVVLFFLYWQGARAQAIADLAAEAGKARAAGYEATYRLTGVDGFPFRLSLRLADAALAPPDRAWRAAAPRFSVHVNIFNPQHAIIGPDGAMTITRKDASPLTLLAKTAAMSVRREGGALARVSLEVETLAITRPQARSLTAGKVLAHLRPAPDKADHWQIVVMADAISPAPDGLAALAPEVAALRVALDADKAFAAAQVVALEARMGPGVLKGAGALTRDGAGAMTGRFDVAADDAKAFAAAPGLLGPDGKAALTLGADAVVRRDEKPIFALTLPK